MVHVCGDISNYIMTSCRCCRLLLFASVVRSKTFEKHRYILAMKAIIYQVALPAVSVVLTNSFDMSHGEIGPVGPRKLDPNELTMEYKYLRHDEDSVPGRVSQWRILPVKQTQRIMENDHMVLYLHGYPFKFPDESDSLT